jgi:hypothetical protein
LNIEKCYYIAGFTFHAYEARKSISYRRIFDCENQNSSLGAGEIVRLKRKMGTPEEHLKDRWYCHYTHHQRDDADDETGDIQHAKGPSVGDQPSAQELLPALETRRAAIGMS